MMREVELSIVLLLSVVVVIVVAIVEMDFGNFGVNKGVVYGAGCGTRRCCGCGYGCG